GELLQRLDTADLRTTRVPVVIDYGKLGRPAHGGRHLERGFGTIVHDARHGAFRREAGARADFRHARRTLLALLDLRATTEATLGPEHGRQQCGRRTHHDK